jgi:predicted metallopeptidase
MKFFLEEISKERKKAVGAEARAELKHHELRHIPLWYCGSIKAAELAISRF